LPGGCAGIFFPASAFAVLSLRYRASIEHLHGTRITLLRRLKNQTNQKKNGAPHKGTRRFFACVLLKEPACF
jgi:hypothetical protein